MNEWVLVKQFGGSVQFFRDPHVTITTANCTEAFHTVQDETRTSAATNNKRQYWLRCYSY